MEIDRQNLLGEQVDIHVHSDKQLPQTVEYCALPVALCCQGRLVIAGLSSVLRLIVSQAQKSHDAHTVEVDHLLGPKQNCLKACAEVSPWTKFCEVTLPTLTERLLMQSVLVSPLDELVLLDTHLAELAAQRDHSGRPAVTVHTRQSAGTSTEQRSVGNSREQIIDFADGERQLSQSSTHVELTISRLAPVIDAQLQITADPETEYVRNNREQYYLEGDFLQLTDLVLFVCLLPALCKSDRLQQSVASLCRVKKWYEAVYSLKSVRDAVVAVGIPLVDLKSVIVEGQLLLSYTRNKSNFQHSADDDSSIQSSIAENKSNSDFSSSFRADIKAKFKATQFSITSVLQKVTQVGLIPITVGSNNSSGLPWTDYPNSVLPSTLIGGVPDKRISRKLEQLENMVAAVMSIVYSKHKESYVIVDFCSGGGHLGILLAYLLPNCQVSKCWCGLIR